MTAHRPACCAPNRRTARLAGAVAVVLATTVVAPPSGRPGPGVGAPATFERTRLGPVMPGLRTDPVEAPATAAPTRLEPDAPSRPPERSPDRSPDRSPPAAPDGPYRVIGRTGAGPDDAVVLFGRGRTVTLAGPGRIDDEHVAEAIGDDYVLVRHLPSGSGAFLPLTPAARATAAGPDPEQLPRD